ncbi:MAG: PEGA domain-containing protein [Bacteroidota bacterium]
MKARLVFGVLLVLSLTGCGTILNGPRQNVPIYSTPEGAEIEINGRPYGTTPAAFRLTRDRTHIVVIRKEGYKEARIVIRRRVDATPLVLNIFVPFYLGYVADFTNGSAFRLLPGQLDIVLEPLEDIANEGETSDIYIP